MSDSQPTIKSWNGQPPNLILVKTFLGMALCFLIAWLFKSTNTAFQAGIATILCLREDRPSTFGEAVNRTIGTFLGGVWAYLMIMLMSRVFEWYPGDILYYMLNCIALTLLVAGLLRIRRPGAIICAVIVYLLATLLINSVNDPFNYVSHRIIDTLIGIAVALFVNWIPPINRYFGYHFGKEKS